MLFKKAIVSRYILFYIDMLALHVTRFEHNNSGMVYTVSDRVRDVLMYCMDSVLRAK